MEIENGTWKYVDGKPNEKAQSTIKGVAEKSKVIDEKRRAITEALERVKQEGVSEKND